MCGLQYFARMVYDHVVVACRSFQYISTGQTTIYAGEDTENLL